MRAIVSDRQQQNAVSCIVHNGSLSGCKIISRQVPALPVNVLIKVPKLTQTIKGHIVWRNQDSAGVEFEWETKPSHEQREAPRQKVIIPAILLDRKLNKLADCNICDASKTGCRISCKTLSKLPVDIYIQTPGLTEPILALVVWRRGDAAGLEFFWENESYIQEDSAEELDQKLFSHSP